MPERFCGTDDVHGGHRFVANDEPGSPHRYCPGLAPHEVQYGQNPGDMHEPKPYTGEVEWENDGSELLHPFVD